MCIINLCCSLLQLCETLVDECLRLGSRDNMSVIIVAFENAPRPSQERIEEYQKYRKALEEEAAKEAHEEGNSQQQQNSNPMG